MPTILIADSGSTKCEWCLIADGKRKSFVTSGISPYFSNSTTIFDLLIKELIPKVKNVQIGEVHYYGTGLGNPANSKMLAGVLKKVIKGAKVTVNTDMLAAARALCGTNKGIACILGTGSNSCYYNGNRISKNGASLGYVLGDEGSGAHLGKIVLQHYLYNTFDEDLKSRFDARFVTNPHEILENVYKMPLPNKYLASFAIFLAENRGHYMVENIIEDGLNDFFFYHLHKYRESWTTPINFIGSVAFGFRDVLQELCNSYELELGNVLKSPMKGLVGYHSR